jgi:hypothetical protein
MATGTATLTQVSSIPDQIAGWTQSLAVQQLDPSAGTLGSVTLNLSSDVTGSLTVQNLEADPATVSAALFAYTTLDLPSGGTLVANPSALVTANLTAGAPSASLALTAAGTNTAEVPVAPFAGMGTLDLPVSTALYSSITGPANASIRLSGDVGATLGTAYTTVPTGSGGSFGFIESWGVSTPPPPTNAITSTPQDVTIADSRTGWVDDAALQQFDPSLGILYSVNISVVSDIEAAAGLENLGPTGSAFSVGETALVSLDRPDGSALFQSTSETGVSGNLAAYDGTTDFSGPSGFLDLSLSGVSNPSIGTEDDVAANDLALFTGTGSISLTATSTGTSSLSGPGNLAAELRANAGAQIAVSYTYVPASASSAGGISCFAEGTRIRTARGEVAAEGLAIGDQVVTRDGRAVPVVWIGHRTIEPERHRRPGDVRPVEVSAHAFGPGMPGRTLVLSPDHAVLFDNVLIPIRLLINGGSVRQVRVTRVTYWHVELHAHDVLLAENLPCESFLDTGNRSAFAEGGACVQLHPDFAARAREARCCAPLVAEGPPVAAARRLLAGRRRLAAG